MEQARLRPIFNARECACGFKELERFSLSYDLLFPLQGLDATASVLSRFSHGLLHRRRLESL